MDGSYPHSLRLWEEGHDASPDLFGPPGNSWIREVAGRQPSNPKRMAEQLFACEALEPRFGTPTTTEGEPYSLQWFLNIENRRLRRSARWIPKLLEFHKHGGETLLGLGHGLGTDWIQYARHGASVIVCSSCQSQLELIERHFRVRDLSGQFLHATPQSLPLENNCIDVACISGLLQQVEQPQMVMAEVYRVLKPGGKVIAVTPAKYDVDYWTERAFFWNRWFRASGSDDDEVRRRFTWRRLRRLFHRFEIHRIKKRQLSRREVPHLWRVLPISALERLIGHVLVVKAFKPVSAAIAEKRAA